MTGAEKYYLGLDLGSSYTKYVVVDSTGQLCFNQVIPTQTRHRDAHLKILEQIDEQFNIHRSCSTGYGRDRYDGDIKKTELVCASLGVSAQYPAHKSIIDVGGEDIKIIESGPGGEVLHFYMNDKCAAGTGAFITEIAEKVELEIAEMSELASRSNTRRTINSFCTVFAKSELLSWKFDEVPIEDIAKGIYLSIVSRLAKLALRIDIPVYICGGVIAFHPYLRELLSEAAGVDIQVVPEPQFMVARGAAIVAIKMRQAS